MALDDIDTWFDHHPPTPHRIVQHEAVRAGAKRFAAELLLAVPEGDEQYLALMSLREASMWANAGIACAPAQQEPGNHAPDCKGCAEARAVAKTRHAEDERMHHDDGRPLSL